jgi:DNA-binding transcriptional ArsR family regulator
MERDVTQLRDLTGGRPNIPIEVSASQLYELAVVGWVLSDKDTCNAHEQGAQLFDALRSALPPDDVELIERMSAAGGALWLGLFSIVEELLEDSSLDADRDVGIEELVSFLEHEPPDRIRMAMLSMLPHDNPGELDAAASGDADALNAVAKCVTDRHPAKEQMVDELRTILAMESSELIADTLAAVRALGSAAASHLERVTPGLRRSAEDARSLALTAPGERVVEKVTKGVEYQVRPGIDQIRLIPSAGVRPWSLMLEDGSTQIFVYPVGEELLGDPDTPPSGLVAVYKALADDRRLRILRRAAGGGVTFAELVEHLDLAKSTVHHHIGILRSAGLVRVTIGDGKETTYRLRAEVLPDTEQRLAHYLTEGHQS